MNLSCNTEAISMQAGVPTGAVVAGACSRMQGRDAADEQRHKSAGNSPKWTLLALCAALALAFSAVDATAQQQVGYVLDMNGDWTLNGSGRLNKGTALPPGGVIRTSAPANGNASIIIADRSGNILEQRHCHNQGECDRPIQLPPVSRTTYAGAIIDAVMGLWVKSEPAKYATLISRGDSLEEAVIRLRRSHADIAPAFKQLKADKYFVKLESVHNDHVTPQKPALDRIAVDWNPARPRPLAVANLRPGLYKLSLLEASGDADSEMGISAWVLASDGRQYQTQARSFRQAVAVTKKWGQDVKPNVVRSFLRTWLEQLSLNQSQRSSKLHKTAKARNNP